MDSTRAFDTSVGLPESILKNTYYPQNQCFKWCWIL